MKLLKFFLTLIGILVVLVLGINFFGHAFASSALSDLLGADVKMSKVHFDPIKGQAGIYDLRIENPEGFQEKQIAEIPEIYLDLDFSKIYQGEIVVSQARLNIQEVTVERSASKNFNLLQLKPLQDMVPGSGQQQPSEPSKEPEPTKDEKKSGLKFSIEEAYLSVGSARYVDYAKDPIVTKELNLGIKEAKIRDIHSTRELVQQVVKKIMAKVSLNALIPDWGQLSASLGDSWNEKMEQLKTGANDLMTRIKDSFEKNEDSGQ